MTCLSDAESEYEDTRSILQNALLFPFLFTEEELEERANRFKEACKRVADERYTRTKCT